MFSLEPTVQVNLSLASNTNQPLQTPKSWYYMNWDVQARERKKIDKRKSTKENVNLHVTAGAKKYMCILSKVFA